ncbi:hypothetical protein ACIGW8_12230 [Streptomyces sioyaensis]|uniref:hypothetical protein n=1 Tax=Streptomyces sioyaensis TaxID=67364 RepID=UPI0037CDB2E4
MRSPSTTSWPIPGILAVSVNIMLAVPRRYWPGAAKSPRKAPAQAFGEAQAKPPAKALGKTPGMTPGSP